jgi:cobalt-zinc-cadmium efflux system outer membrane protein
MQAGASDLLQAKREEIRAGSEYIEAVQDYWLARTNLERAVGGRLPIDATVTTAPAPTSTPASEPSDHQRHHH